MSVQDELDEDSTCDAIGHDDRLVYEDEYGSQWICDRCGAEMWEDA